MACASSGVLDHSNVFGPALGNMRADLGGSAHGLAWLASYESGGRIAAHGHEKPYLSLFLLGSCHERSAAGEAVIGGPSAALHWPGCTHEDRVGGDGLVAVVVEFDPAWLSEALRRRCRPRASRYWTNGPVSGLAPRLGRRWLEGTESRQTLLDATATFLRQALGAGAAPARPHWLDAVEVGLESPPATADLSRSIGVHPAWLARAYRAYRGEGLQEAQRRRRAGIAARLLRETDMPLAEAAAEAGFCDQSHMNRALRALLGLTPAQLRAKFRPSSGFQSGGMSRSPFPPEMAETAGGSFACSP
jgi:AraC family transcriptional regulator